MKTVLVTRFSAFGDVAMTVPVIKQFLQQNPDVEMVYVSRGFVEPLFQGIERLHFFSADLNDKHKGVFGLFRLFKQLRKEFDVSAYADLHNVLRTKILGLYFFSSVPVKRIDKGRESKKRLTAKEPEKDKKQLLHTSERYAEVFRKLGFAFEFSNSFDSGIDSSVVKEKGILGIAPFAQHKWKMYPEDKMKEVVFSLAEKGHKILLFGGGKTEIERLKSWEALHENVESVAGKFSLSKELELLKNLKLLISMDSANMHLASLVGTKVISIWGATHPYAGFLGIGQSPKDTITLDLECSPCSVFGNKECYKGDFACMQGISPRQIILKVESVLT